MENDNVVLFSPPVKSTSQLVSAFEVKANACGLIVDCPADGIFNAEIAIVAEAPGEREVNGKSPLIGASGSLLWTVLRQHGITRNDCFITNVSKRQLSFDRDDKKSMVGRHEMDQWSDLLRWELSQLPNLRIVVMLGNYALSALTGNEGIIHWRGSVLSIDSIRSANPVRGIAAYNPAYVLRAPKEELIFRLDLGRVKRLREGRWREPKIETIINPSLDDAISYLRTINNSGNPISYDIETMGGETACVGFADSATEAMCINFRTRRDHRFTEREETTLRREIQHVLGNPENQLIAQNNMFDSSWLWYKDKIKVAPAYIDTMLAHHTLYPQMPHNLGYLTTQYTMHPYYKDDKFAWREGGDIDTYWRYNGKDCCTTWAVAHAELRELKAAHLDEFFFGHVMRLQSHLCRMVVGGVLVDASLKNKVADELKEVLNAQLAAFNNAVQIATNDPTAAINPNSPAQLSELLFNRLKLVGRGASTDDENRKRMFAHPRTTQAARDVITALDSYKTEAKFYSTYAVTETDNDDRMRTEYKQTGVQNAPGRLSSAKVPWGHVDPMSGEFIQHGTNMQNQPQRAHQMYIADPGYTLVYFDAAQAEARIVGWDAKIDKWKEQFERARLDGSYDAHCALASEMYRIPYNDVPTFDHYDTAKGNIPPEGFKDGDMTIRYKAKRCRHGLNYRMQPDRLASTAGLPLAEAQRSFELYHRITPELRPWWRSKEEEARKSRILYNAYGRRLFIQGRMDDPETLESIVAFYPQSTLGDKICKVIYQCHDDERWKPTWRIALNIHDALIALVPIEDARLAASIMKKYAEEPIMIRGEPLIIPADCGIGVPGEDGIIRWSTIKKVKDIECAR